MKYLQNISVEMLEASVAIFTTIVALVIYWGITAILKKKSLKKSVPFSLKHILFLRIVGFVCFGILSFFVAWFIGSNLFYSTLIQADWARFVIILSILVPVILFINFRLSTKEQHQEHYPPIRKKEWNRSLILLNSLTWILYLTGYEFLFRGFLLYSCLNAFGTTMAIIINVVFYSIAHLPKGKFETIGSIPLGVVFCFITLVTNTFWTVCILHCVIALSTDFFSVQHNPDMKWSIRKKELAS